MREVAFRADEVRFIAPEKAVGIAEAAIRALFRLKYSLQSSALAALTWSVYGSALRSVARLEEAEAALKIAAKAVPLGDLQTQRAVARRLAYLKAEQRRPEDVTPLLDACLKWGKEVGGWAYGEELVNAGAILIILGDFERATPLTETALSFLPRDGDRFHLSAVFNLARCRLELDSSVEDLEAAISLLLEAASYIESGTYPEFKLFWVQGLLLQRLGRFKESLVILETAQAGIEAGPNGLDQALLMLDLADLHLDLGNPQSAQQLALSSFPTLKLLRTNPEAYRALKTFHRAAQDKALDSALIASVRDRLRAS